MADTDGTLIIQYGVCEYEQQSSFANATLQELKLSKMILSVAVELPSPPLLVLAASTAAKRQAALSDWLQRLFDPLVRAGAQVMVQVGPPGAGEDDDG